MVKGAGVRLSPVLLPLADGYDYRCVIGNLQELRQVVIQFRQSTPRFSVEEVEVIPIPGEVTEG
jgi:hypothetical protein